MVIALALMSKSSLMSGPVANLHHLALLYKRVVASAGDECASSRFCVIVMMASFDGALWGDYGEIVSA